MGSLSGLLNRAAVEVDYIEKASNSGLNSETANKGLNNYTKYSRDINALGLAGCQGQPWCATYQFWLEVQEFGLEKALEHWNMTKKNYVGYNCFSTYNKFKAAGKVSKVPKLGALVIFTFSHMARVIKISADGKKFWTNEGNTSAKTYDRNGGMVAEKSYSVSDSKIKGFCIIDYDAEIDVNKTETDMSSANKNKEGAYMFEVKNLVKGDTGAQVELLQRLLIGHGYSVGKYGPDGDFGDDTEAAVKKFQKDEGIQVSYPGTVGSKTWKALLGI